jgi:hypothetical protein
MFNRDKRIEQMLEEIQIELDQLRVVAKRTETRLCTLANHLGASHVGAPVRTNQPPKEHAA